MNQRLRNCPVCNSTLEIVEYHCSSCDTTIKGKFGVGDLAALTAAQQDFVVTFLCCQGNIKEVEKALGISYPTVKSRLAEVVKVLCPAQKPKVDESVNLDLLNQLEKGNLSIDEALNKLKRS